MLIAVTILVIITFIWFWNGSMAGKTSVSGGVKFASIYGRTLYVTDVERDVNKLRVALALGLDPLVEALSGGGSSQQAQLDFVFNSYVLDHEADALQVSPTDEEVQAEEARLPGLQTDGKFDPAKLSQVVTSMLPSLGFTDSIIDDLVREQVKLKKLNTLVGSTVDLSQAELDNRFTEATEKMDVAVIHLNTSDLEKSISVTDDDALKTYNARKEQYRSEEQRKVAIAAFELTDAQKNLKGKERTDALQKLGSDAWNFAQAVVDKNADFAAQAKTYGAKLSASPLFTADAPDPAYQDVPALTSDAFKLSSDYPSSDVLDGKDGYYVLHLEATVPSQQETFDQAKAQIITDIRKERAAQLMQTRAEEVRTGILASLKAGKSLKDAATAEGVTAETIPPFSLMEASRLEIPDVQQIVDNAISLSKGQFSDFIPTATGGIYVYLQNREPVGAADAALGEEAMRDQYLRRKQTGTFLEWLRLRRQAARLEIAGNT